MSEHSGIAITTATIILLLLYCYNCIFLHCIGSDLGTCPFLDPSPWPGESDARLACPSPHLEFGVWDQAVREALSQQLVGHLRVTWSIGSGVLPDAG